MEELCLCSQEQGYPEWQELSRSVRWHNPHALLHYPRCFPVIPVAPPSSSRRRELTSANPNEQTRNQILSAQMDACCHGNDDGEAVPLSPREGLSGVVRTLVFSELA